ncbi:MAG: gas vesicle protein GvpL [Thermoplasmata archaeon]
MQHTDDIRLIPPREGEAATKVEGRYLYCVADSGEKASLGPIGIDGQEVYTIPYKDICVVVHDCPAEPYQSTDAEVVKGWVMAHQRVVDKAWEKWGTVLPLGFDTIVRGQGGGDPQANVESWLAADYRSLKRKMEAVRGKAEYGVQVFWDPQVIAREVTEMNPEISRLEEEMRSKPRGLAYMYKQKLENILKREMETKANRCFNDFYYRIKKHICDLRVEKTKRTDDDRQMIMNLSCLAYRDRSTDLGEELEGIDRMDGFSVRFTGPWPPYSFVSA